MKNNLIVNYRSKTYTLKEPEVKYLQNDYQVFHNDKFEQSIDDLILDIENVLNQ